MTAPSGGRRLLVISNGIGEDSIGAELVRRLPPGIAVDAYPTLGSGAHYQGVAPLVGPRARLPSEGSRVARGTIAGDIASGGLATIPPALAFLRRVRRTYDAVLVIGDFIGVAACWLAGIRGIIYLDVYKSGQGRPYLGLERRVIAATCRTVFSRSPQLAAALKAAGVDARAAGNVMLDTIPSAAFDAPGRRRHATAVTLLPGSRGATAANFALQVAALRRLPEAQRPDVFLALAGEVDPHQLARAAGLGWNGEADCFSGDVEVHVARGALRELLAASDLVLSQAGTATIQALGSGVPAISFAGTGGERRKRLREESRLFGEARLLVAADPAALAAALAGLLGDPAERARRAAIGRQRIGGPGAMAAIISCITEHLEQAGGR